MEIECSTDGTLWTPVENSDQPPMGTLCRFGGSGHLSAIYECIVGGTLEPSDIAEKLGLPVWAVKDLLEGGDSDLSGD